MDWREWWEINIFLDLKELFQPKSSLTSYCVLLIILKFILIFLILSTVYHQSNEILIYRECRFS